MEGDFSEFKKDLSIHIRARYPTMAILTADENAMVNIIKYIGINENKTVFVWSEASGFKDAEGHVLNDKWCIQSPNDYRQAHDEKPCPTDPLMALEMIRTKIVDDINGQDDKNKAIQTQGNVFVMLDFKGFSDGLIARKIRDMVNNLKGYRKSIIFVSPQFDIPETLKETILLMNLPYPDRSGIESVLNTAIYGLSGQETHLKRKIIAIGQNSDESSGTKEVLFRLQQKKKKIEDQIAQSKEAIIDALSGINYKDVENIIAICMIQGDFNIEEITREKERMRTGFNLNPDPSIDQIMNNLAVTLDQLKKYKADHNLP